ncbi:MAG TPA: sigma-70 family RNA polymerase sigma factor [Bryobacteraceae bacterium]|nr:sigma-70 family RNA polymerase sigma factor [Bryobacteraceae bacterium]
MAALVNREQEIELARRLLAGDAGAFDDFVDHFRAKVFHYTWLMCGHKEDAEEVAQETLLKAFQNFEQLREPDRVRSWIFRIAKNECLMKRRKSLFAPARELSLEELMPSKSSENGRMKLDIADWSQVPDDQALQAEMRAALGRAIGQLPELYRSVILLRDLEELSTQETAAILDVSEDVVKTRLHRARLTLRKTLDQYLLAGSLQSRQGET